MRVVGVGGELAQAVRAEAVVGRMIAGPRLGELMRNMVTFLEPPPGLDGRLVIPHWIVVGRGRDSERVGRGTGEASGSKVLPRRILKLPCR